MRIITSSNQSFHSPPSRKLRLVVAAASFRRTGFSLLVPVPGALGEGYAAAALVASQWRSDSFSDETGPVKVVGAGSFGSRECHERAMACWSVDAPKKRTLESGWDRSVPTMLQAEGELCTSWS